MERGSVRQCSIVRGSSVRQQCAALYSMYGSVQQCVWQRVVVRDIVFLFVFIS
jgi:hypothetical protein